MNYFPIKVFNNNKVSSIKKPYQELSTLVTNIVFQNKIPYYFIFRKSFRFAVKGKII